MSRKTYTKITTDSLGRAMVGLYHSQTHKWIRWLSTKEDGISYGKRTKTQKERCKQPNVYIKRNIDLALLGYNSYSDYLKSPEWRTFVDTNLPGSKCVCCKSSADIFHHRKYSRSVLRLYEKSVKVNLIPLCNDCHYKIEFRDDGTKRMSGRELTFALRELQIAYGTFSSRKCIRCGNSVTKGARGRPDRLCRACKKAP